MEKLNMNCGPMSALKCTIRYTAKHGLTRIYLITIEVFKSIVWTFLHNKVGGAHNA